MKFLDACFWLVESANRGAGWSLLILLTLTLSVGPATVVDPAQPTDERAKRIEGTVFKQTVQGTRPIRDGVIFLEGVETRGSNQPPLMDQIHTTFQPHILPVQVGQPIMFLNSDSKIHNVRLNERDNGTQLMNELMPPGDSVTYTPKRLGIIQVRCDIHPSMKAVVLVRLERFRWAPIQSDGHFRIKVPGPPEGEHTIHVWNEKEGFLTRSHTFSGDTTASLSLILDPDDRSDTGE